MKPKWDERRLAVWRNQGIKGMTRGLFFKMWEQQSGMCAICKEILTTGTSGRSGFTLDHDHQSGLPRALLCQGCNKHSALKENADLSLYKTTPFYDYVLQHRKENRNVEKPNGGAEECSDSDKR